MLANMTFVETCVVNQCRARHTTTPVAQTQLTQHSTHSTAHTLQSELEKKKEKKRKKKEKKTRKNTRRLKKFVRAHPKPIPTKLSSFV